MRAIRVHEHGGPEVLKLEEVKEPRPSEGQVLVKVGAAGVNPVDTYIRGGVQGYAAKLPWTPGLDAAGVVDEVAPDVDTVAPGDRVYCIRTATGSYAELAVCDAGSVFPLPERVSFAQGASVPTPYATAYRALFQRGGAGPGETVLVHGASGGVGLAAVQLARAAGLQVLGTAGSDAGKRLVAAEGAHHVLDHGTEGHLEEAVELTGGRGVDLILEMLANVHLGRDLVALAPRGRVVVIGSRGTVEINPRDTMGRDADIRGMALFNASPAELRSIHAAVVAGLENGALSPVVGRELPLAEAPEAHLAVMAAGKQGNVVLVP